MHLLVDSTGLKLCGAGERLLEKHGTRLRRSWRPLHVGVDADTGRIVAATLSTSDVDHASQVSTLLDQAGPLALFTADGAYDQDGAYGEIARRSPDAAVIVPPRSSGHAERLTMVLPSFDPVSVLMNADGALSNPLLISLRTLILPTSSHLLVSVTKLSSWSVWSHLMKPRTADGGRHRHAEPLDDRVVGHAAVHGRARSTIHRRLRDLL